jgi:predicted enzyme related to lactoylglutathione lyase
MAEYGRQPAGFLTKYLPKTSNLPVAALNNGRSRKDRAAMPRVVHFELAADDLERATRFYSSVFGWQFHKWDGPMDYLLVKTGEEGLMGINGGMMKACEEFKPGYPMHTLDVSSVDEYVTKITEAGGTICMPKHAIPGVGWLAYAKDTEGNFFGIMQEDVGAA